MLERARTMHYLRMPCSIEKLRKIVVTKIDMVDNLSQHLHLLPKVWQHCWTMPALKGFLRDAVGASYFSLARFTVQQDKSSEENFSEQHLQCLQCTHVVHFPCKASTPIPSRIWNLESGRVGKPPMLCRFGFLHASGLEIHHDLNSQVVDPLTTNPQTSGCDAYVPPGASTVWQGRAISRAITSADVLRGANLRMRAFETPLGQMSSTSDNGCYF